MKSRVELRHYHTDISDFRRRLLIVAAGVVVAFALLVVRWVDIQILHHNDYLVQAENNRISLIPITPNRGIITDRNGRVLANNYSAYTVELTPSKITNLNDTINAIAHLIPITPVDRRKFFKSLADNHHFASLPLRTHLTDEEAAKIAANMFRLPGVEVNARLFRHYPQGKVAAHLLGYVSRLNDADIAKLQSAGRYDNYQGADHIGKTGIEQSYEALLHGNTGYEQVETDAGGHAVRLLAHKPPISGDKLTLWLDSRMEAIAEKAFGDHRGALVAIDVHTGGILAMVSQPGFDPNLFIDGIDSADWDALNNSPDHPLIDRALRSAYPEGSTLKPFMALAGLHYGVRTPEQTIYDPGYFAFPGSSHHYRDWAPNGHGTVDMHKSLVVSCDTYYYRLANDLGIVRMHDFLSQFGFGRKTGIDLEGEKAGVLPSPAWKAKFSRQPWYPGETVICGIGQGYNLATPLQLAVATASLANGGTVLRPQLVQRIVDSHTGITRDLPAQIVGRINLPPAQLKVIVDAMIDVTRPGGTAVGAFVGTPYLVAAKTGTAQVVGIRQNEKYHAADLDITHRDHAVLIAFAPADAPKIAVAVLVENGGHGGTAAGPIARAVMDYYLLGKSPAPAPQTGGPVHGH